MKKKIFEGKILGLSVHTLTIRGRKVTREIIEHRGAAAMLAIDKDKKVILVKQNRYPRGNILEIPAGTLEKGENPKKCAFRELQEETGYKARKMSLNGSIPTTATLVSSILLPNFVMLIAAVASSRGVAA